MRRVRSPCSLVAARRRLACGDDASCRRYDAPPGPAPTADGGYGSPPATDDVVISVAYEGGFAPVEMLFARTPVTLITGDGRALSTGPVPAIFPGPLLPNVLQRTITPEATQELVALADELGLLADITYAPNNMVADAADTVVTITVDGTTYEHRAYALGIDDEEDPDRDHLMQFVTAMTDLPTTVGADQLGPEEPYIGEEYLIRATPVDLDTSTFEVEPTVVEWPADAPVRLADAADCAERSRPRRRAAVRRRHRPTTFFSDAGHLPGRSSVPARPRPHAADATLSTTTERRTSPRSILWKASSTASRAISSLTKRSRSRRPWR